VFQAPATSLQPFTPIDPSRSMGRAYLRFLVKDEPGVIAAVSETLAEAGVSIESFLQKPVGEAAGVPIVLTTHAVAESVLTAAIERIASLPAVLDRPRLLRIARI
jgi:homoserine dehydrogenase